MRTDLPTGTVTLLFTDIEGSTRLLHDLGPEAYVEALSEHRRLLREAFARHGGVEVDTQGDAFLYAFTDAREAVEAAEEGREALLRHSARTDPRPCGDPHRHTAPRLRGLLGRGRPPRREARGGRPRRAGADL